MMNDIFLSYSTKDKNRLQLLFNALQQSGWSVFWDHTSIHTGENWHRKIDGAINNCRCVLVVWSKYSVQSEWVLEEAHKGKNRGVLLPIKVDDIDPPFGFSLRQIGDFTHWNGKINDPVFIELTTQINSFLTISPNPKVITPIKQKSKPWGFILVAIIIGFFSYIGMQTTGKNNNKDIIKSPTLDNPAATSTYSDKTIDKILSNPDMLPGPPPGPYSASNNFTIAEQKHQKLLIIARGDFWNNDLNNSIQTYNKILTDLPNSLPVKGELANVLWKQGNAKMAAQLFREISPQLQKEGRTTEAENMKLYIDMVQ